MGEKKGERCREGEEERVWVKQWQANCLRAGVAAVLGLSPVSCDKLVGIVLLERFPFRWAARSCPQCGPVTGRVVAGVGDRVGECQHLLTYPKKTRQAMPTPTRLLVVVSYILQGSSGTF